MFVDDNADDINELRTLCQLKRLSGLLGITDEGLMIKNELKIRKIK